MTNLFAVWVFLFAVFLPSKTVSDMAYPLVQKTLPMMCMPIRVFEAGQKNLKEKQVLFGILKHAPEILFEVYKSSNNNKPSFSVTLRRKNEICIIAAGGELIPTFWLSEPSCLVN